MLLRQTNAAKVVPAWTGLLRLAATPGDLAVAPPAAVEDLLRPLGLQRQRARALHDLATAVMERHGCIVPRRLQDLMALPHVGPYAAGAVRVFVLRKRAPLPDVNVARIGARYYALPEWTKAQRLTVAQKVLEACPRGLERDFHYALLDLAALVCRPRPRCTECPLRRGCRFGRAASRQALGGI